MPSYYQTEDLARYILDPETDPTELSSKVTLSLKPGQTISVQTPGGGGFGDPHQRDPAAVLRDVREGKVSVGRARDVYGLEDERDRDGR